MTNEFLLKEACYLLYRIFNSKSAIDLSREEYLIDLENRFKDQIPVKEKISNKKEG